MISQVTFFVEHGEDATDFAAFCEFVSALPTDHAVTVLDYSPVVDVDDTYWKQRHEREETEDALKGLSWDERARIEHQQMLLSKPL